MIDIHSHILPGVDDGSQTLGETIEILRQVSDKGVKTIVATPHILDFPSESSWQKVKGIFDNVRQAVRYKKIDIEIVLGAELFIAPDLPLKIRQNKEVTINNGGRYVLIELPMQEIPVFTDEIIFELLVQGIVPIIAHPERYMEIQKDTDKLLHMIKKGVLAQVNAGSLTGKYGRKVQKTAKTLLAYNLIHMMGSDIHSVSSGSYTLPMGMNMAADIIGRERTKALTASVPERIIGGEMIEATLSAPSRRRIFINFIKGSFQS